MNIALTDDKSIQLFTADGSFAVFAEDSSYDEILDLAVSRPIGWEDRVKELILPEIRLARYCEQKGKFYISDGAVYYDGVLQEDFIVDKILELIRLNKDIDWLLAFKENLDQNPSAASRADLYRFLEHNNLPLTSDGHFLSYKFVNEDYFSHHYGDNEVKISNGEEEVVITGRVPYIPGTKISMARSEVASDRSQTCSYGLHSCGWDYAGAYNNSYRTMIVKINPRDVVSVPIDANNAKIRSCEMYVVGEADSELIFSSDNLLYEEYDPNALISVDEDWKEKVQSHNNVEYQFYNGDFIRMGLKEEIPYTDPSTGENKVGFFKKLFRSLFG